MQKLTDVILQSKNLQLKSGILQQVQYLMILFTVWGQAEEIRQCSAFPLLRKIICIMENISLK